jgi:hypothetical protein
MAAQIFSKTDFLSKLVERDIDSFLNGRDREMCQANIGRALGFGLFDQIDAIRGAWAEAERVKAKQQQAEGA